MTVVCAVSSAAGLRLLATAARAGLLPTGSPRVLLTWNDAVIPEVAADITCAEPALVHFDEVVDLNSLLAPYHPDQWRPGDSELPMLRRLLADHLPAVTELVVSNLDHPITRTLARVFDAASISVFNPSLSAFGPASYRRPAVLVERVSGFWHADLVPGLRAVGQNSRPVAVPSPPANAPAPVLVVGSDFVGSGLLTAAGEVETHLLMIQVASREGAPVLFCPDPKTPPAQRWLIRRASAEAGIEAVISQDDPDQLAATLRPRLVVGCGASALLRMHASGAPAMSVGADVLLAKMSPFHHPGRIALTIADAMLRADPAGMDLAATQRLLEAVTYLMRPEWAPQLRDAAEAAVAELSQDDQVRYLRRLRLEAVGMARPEEPPAKTVPRVTSLFGSRPKR